MSEMLYVFSTGMSGTGLEDDLILQVAILGFHVLCKFTVLVEVVANYAFGSWKCCWAGGKFNDLRCKCV
jgi:hypothetical protein